MDPITTIFSIIILIISVMFHELAHGVAADQLGDPTPGLAGRLTLNPIAHLEWMGSFIIPIICIISGSGFIIGWAKPVPFNPNHLSNKRWGPAIVAAAGPLTNMIIAVIAGLVFRMAPSAVPLLAMVAVINISLAIFNLVPVPPLDGHHILGAIFPKYRAWSERVMHQYGLVLLVIVIFFAGSVIGPVISFFARLIIGA